MIELRIDTAERALRLLEVGWPTVAVSLVGDDLRFPLPSFGPHHLVARFHDVEEAGAVGYLAPTKQQISEILDHTASIQPGDRLLVHCHAGKSRSPAMAMGILVQSGMTPQTAFGQVKATRPELIPNRLMIRYIDELLGLGGDLVRLVAAHYAALGPDIALPDRGGLNK